MIAAGLHPDPTYGKASLLPQRRLRRQGIDTLKRGIDLCAEIGAKSHQARAEGYQLHLPTSVRRRTGRRFVEGVAELTDHATRKRSRSFWSTRTASRHEILMQTSG